MLQNGHFVVLYMTANENRTYPNPLAMNSEEINREFIRLKDAAYRYAVALLHDHNEAADATQDLYEKLWQRRLFIRRNGFESLVMVSIRNICFDRIKTRQRGRQFTPLEDVEALRDNPTNTPADNEQQELLSIVRRLMAALPEREREVLHLRDNEGLEFEHIAEIVGSTEAAVRMACSRARGKIKEELVKIMNYGV